METPRPTLPKGIFFEAPRQRWRVRLYKQGEVIHLTYHKSLDSAMHTWLSAKAQQRHAVKQTFIPKTQSISGLLQTLAATLKPHFTFKY